MPVGRSVRLFLIDGSPTGLIAAEIINWTGHILVASRSRLPEALQRAEALRTGAYVLFGPDPDQPFKPRVYIGEGDNIADRIKSHSRDDAKDFWERVCFITSKDTNLTKAHVRYLECRLVELTLASNRANLANGNEPARKLLPESEIADMEFFLEQLQLILPIVGLDFLRPRPTVGSESANAGAVTPRKQTLELELVSDKYRYRAQAVESEDEITVLKGSRGTTASFVSNSYGQLRVQLIKSGALKEIPNEPYVEFTQDVTFDSPSAAAAVIKNRNTNGRTAWVLKGTGQTLKEWQTLQIEKTLSAP